MKAATIIGHTFNSSFGVLQLQQHISNASSKEIFIRPAWLHCVMQWRKLPLCPTDLLKAMSVTFKSSERVFYISTLKRSFFFHFSLLFTVAFLSVGKQNAHKWDVQAHGTEEASARHSFELLNLVASWTEARTRVSLPTLLCLINELHPWKPPTSHRKVGKGRSLGDKMFVRSYSHVKKKKGQMPSKQLKELLWLPFLRRQLEKTREWWRKSSVWGYLSLFSRKSTCPLFGLFITTPPHSWGWQECV